MYGIDASYAISETWKATAYFTYVQQALNVAVDGDLGDKTKAAHLRALPAMPLSWRCPSTANTPAMSNTPSACWIR